MPALAGKGLVIQVATTSGGTYNTVVGMNDASMSIDGDNQDITAFGDSYIARIQGLKDVSYSLSGYFDATDTTGQIRIRTALLNDSELHVKFLPDGTNGFRQQVRVSSFEMSGSVDGIVEVSIELEGTGAIAAVP
jgi:predicted secreted protein